MRLVMCLGVGRGIGFRRVGVGEGVRWKLREGVL
jgi:hypothetical protein